MYEVAPVHKGNSTFCWRFWVGIDGAKIASYMRDFILFGGGALFVFVALLIFVVKVDVARDNSGGAPYLDGIVFPPLFAAFGIGFLLEGMKVDLGNAWLSYIGIWLVLTSIAAGIILRVSRQVGLVSGH